MDSVWDVFQHSKDKNHAPFRVTCKNHEVRDASHKINVLRIRIGRAYHMKALRRQSENYYFLGKNNLFLQKFLL